MVKKGADSEIVQIIYNLAGRPSQVKTTSSALFGMLAYGITLKGVCEVIQEWIDAGKPIQEGVTREVEPHAGKVHYIMKPKINEQQFYLKVGIEKDQQTGEHLMIISFHVPR